MNNSSKQFPKVAIGALVFNHKNQLLLLKSPKWHDRYIVPSGHVDFGEKLEDTVKREVKEETGLDVDQVKFLRLDELIQSAEYHDKNRHWVSVNFTCKTKDDKITLNEEATEYIWVSPKDALNYDLESLTKASVKKYLSVKN